MNQPMSTIIVRNAYESCMLFCPTYPKLWQNFGYPIYSSSQECAQPCTQYATNSLKNICSALRVVDRSAFQVGAGLIRFEKNMLGLKVIAGSYITKFIQSVVCKQNQHWYENLVSSPAELILDTTQLVSNFALNFWRSKIARDLEATTKQLAQTRVRYQTLENLDPLQERNVQQISGETRGQLRVNKKNTISHNRIAQERNQERTQSLNSLKQSIHSLEVRKQSLESRNGEGMLRNRAINIFALGNAIHSFFGEALTPIYSQDPMLTKIAKSMNVPLGEDVPIQRTIEAFIQATGKHRDQIDQLGVLIDRTFKMFAQIFAHKNERVNAEKLKELLNLMREVEKMKQMLFVVQDLPSDIQANSASIEKKAELTQAKQIQKIIQYYRDVYNQDEPFFRNTRLLIDRMDIATKETQAKAHYNFLIFSLLESKEFQAKVEKAFVKNIFRQFPLLKEFNKMVLKNLIEQNK